MKKMIFVIATMIFSFSCYQSFSQSNIGSDIRMNGKDKDAWDALDKHYKERDAREKSDREKAERAKAEKAEREKADRPKNDGQVPRREQE